MADGWSHKKREAIEMAFYAFLNRCYINSKDLGRICLGEHLYQGQIDAITEIFDALEEGIHRVFILKSRQLGISTIIRALIIFLLGIHRGLKGAIVFDSDSNRVESRAEIEVMIEDLPKTLKFPAIKNTNRAGLTLANDSKVLFMSAGVKKSKSSGTLGRSVGLSLAHLCMAPGTPVITGDGWIKKIEDVRVGDRVVTHSGAYGHVLANMARANFSSLLKITPWLGQPTLCTPEHKIPTSRGLLPAGELRKYDIVLMPIRVIVKEQHSSFLPGNLSGHRGKVSAGAKAEIPLNEEVGFAVGYYLAEGAICYQRRDEKYYDYPSGIVFARHRKEQAYADRAIAALKPFTTGSRGTAHSKNSLTTTETIYSAALARWFVQHFGAQDNKCIPDKIFTWGEDFCRGLLAGMLCGDGSKTVTYAQKYPLNTVRISTTRSSLAMQIRDIAASLGYGWAGWHEAEAGERYGRNCKHIWTVLWNGRCAAGLRSLMGLSVVGSKKHFYSEKFFVWPGYIGLKIRKIELVAPTTSVHDLSVDHTDHTFRTPSMAVSNSELCSYDNDEGLEAFENSLSDINPDRLYIYESTARGFNKWFQLWRDARKDTLHCKCIFLGWFTKNSQKIDREHPDFFVYGVQPPTEKELEKIAAVRDQYSVEISAEQLAWIRRKMDPTAKDEGDNNTEYEGTTERIQEQPWTEEDAFQQTGSIFFAAKDLTDLTNKFAKRKSKNYMMIAGEEFADMKIYPSQNARSTELRVWEEPAIDAVYVLGIDPAYGENDKNCNSVIEVLRCYADGWDQVAEYAWPLMTTRHLAWTLAALLGWYGSGRNEARYILELNGPGEATFNEIRSLRFQIEHAKHLQQQLEQKGLLDVFKNVKTYLYTKPDALGSSYNFHWTTSTQKKITLLERLRDVTSNGKGRVRSYEAIEEMRSVSREGSSIGAPGSMRDDRVIGMALANYYWETRIRPTLITQRRTRDAEEARQRMSIVDQVGLFNQNNLETFFAQKRQARTTSQLQMMRQQWRFGSRRY